MRYVIAYDISDDRRRARVAKRLEAVADRVQGSVFETDLNDKALTRLLEQLAKAIDAETDGVRVYRLCGDCASVVKIIGQSKIIKPPELVIV
jgi:CRISPR-associated protein Cas2